MPLFQNSSTTVATAQTRIARAGGSNAHASELTLALEALQEAVRWFNQQDLWDWCRTIAADVAVSAETATYDLPYNLRAMYDVRLTGNPRKLTYINRRYYDTIQYDQSNNATPEAYDMFLQGGLGKIQLIPTPSETETLSMKYYRRLWVPCSSTVSCTGTLGELTLSSSAGFDGVTVGSVVSGTGIAAGAYVVSIADPSTLTLSAVHTGTVNGNCVFGATNQFIDIPADYEGGLIAKATEIYLASRVDRGVNSGRLEWFRQHANDMLAAAKANNTNQPDEELVFLTPSDVGNVPYNPNSVAQAFD